MEKTFLLPAVFLLLAGCAKEGVSLLKPAAEEETAISSEDSYIKGEVKVRFTDEMAAEIESENAVKKRIAKI